MCTYLEQVGSVYYFRRNVPEELHPFLFTKTGKPRTIWKVSLRTKDREEAKRLIPDHVKMTDREIDAARAMLAAAIPKSPADIAAQRRADYRERARIEAEEEWARMQQRIDDARDARIEEQESLAKSLRVRLVGSTEFMAPEDAVIARMLREQQEGARLTVKALRNEIARLKANTRTESASDSLNAISSPQAPALPFSPNVSTRAPQGKIATVSISSLFDMLAAQPGRLVPSIRKEWQASIRKFIAFLGHDDARQVTARNILEWRNHARDEPKANGQPRSAARVNAGYLSPLRAVFSLAVDEMLLEDNPASGVSTLREVKKPKVRDRQFTKEGRQTILAAARSFSNPRLTPHRQLAHRWVPWICAYSGARVNEITQMRAEDVTQVEGYWVFKITPEAGQTKTKDFRYVPIHEHLIEQGILAIAKAQGSGPLFYDPERGRPESERGQYKKTGEALARWVRGLGITDPDIQPKHAWRHTFTSMAMVAGIDERAADYMKGHASQGVSRKNYTHHSMDSLIPEMAKFPRFQID